MTRLAIAFLLLAPVLLWQLPAKDAPHLAGHRIDHRFPSTELDRFLLQEPEDEGYFEEAKQEAADLQQDIRANERDLVLAKAHLDLLGVQQEAAALDAGFALEDSREARQAYVSHEAEAERRQRELELMEMRTSLQDAKDEREQLGMMYEQNALADATAQIVLQRSDREIKQQELALTLTQDNFNYWLNAGVPRQQRQLEREVRAAEMSLRLLEATQPVERLEMEQSVRGLEEQLASLHQQAADLAKELESEDED